MIPPPGHVSEVLNDAADEIECEGWTTGAYVTHDGICATEALSRASGLRERYTETSNSVFQAALDALHGVVDPPASNTEGLSPITFWNDHQTDPHVVIDALRRAARRTRHP